MASLWCQNRSKTPGIKKIINWGTKKYDAKENRSDS